MLDAVTLGLVTITFLAAGGVKGVIGLGLPTVHRVVENHGGSLSLESSPGAGTTVRVRLPAAESGA